MLNLENIMCETGELDQQFKTPAALAENLGWAPELTRQLTIVTPVSRGPDSSGLQRYQVRTLHMYMHVGIYI